MTTRAIIIDDSSARINYDGGSWFEDKGSQDQAGNFGPPFRRTLHGTQASASLSFSFSGTSVKVYGSNNLRNDSGVLDPTLECYVDHVSIRTSSPFPYPENNWLLCEQPLLVDGPHTLTVNATVAKKQTFWFDCIHYIPSPTASTEQQLVYVGNRDPDLKFGPGWATLEDMRNVTNERGTTFEFEFTGVSLSWFSMIPDRLPGKPTTGTYTVDGGSPQTFNLKGHEDNVPAAYNQEFFETPLLPMGRHKLDVVYNGNSDTTPLTFEYLVVQNGTASSSNPTPSSTPSNVVAEKKINIGAIVGGVVSTVVVIISLLLAFCFLRRRKQRQETQKRSRDSEVHPFQYQPATSPILSSKERTGGDASDTHPGQYTNNPSDGSRGDAYLSQAAPQSVPRLIISSKARGPMFQRGSSQVYTDVAPTRIVRHEDSGMRMRDDNLGEVIELPPQYTVG